MRLRTVAAAMVGLALVGITGVSAPPADAGAPVIPRLEGVSAEHLGIYDRVSFHFVGGLPSDVQAEYTRELTEPGSGRRVHLPGQAILEVRFGGAVAHTLDGRSTVARRRAWALPNVMVTQLTGDFEAVVNYGIGLASPQRVWVQRDPAGGRIVVNVQAAFETVRRRVYFLNEPNFEVGDTPYVKGVWRPVLPTSPATGVMDRLFAGPTRYEHRNGLRFVRSRAADYSHLSIAWGKARVRLRGGCDSGGSTFTIANEIMPSLRQFPTVHWVKIHGPGGATQEPFGFTDSIPECLEP